MMLSLMKDSCFHAFFNDALVDEKILPSTPSPMMLSLMKDSSFDVFPDDALIDERFFLSRLLQ